ncbi:MAG: tRNA guanosine(15) transglycosylase TgtA [Thermoplasmata archaeon]|nr:tRNA guanosine(15) transglycosylase TgtA [Thermoplasmata archaeon]
MTEFEVLERDGLARIGRLGTPHGPIETPALLPVVHPDPTRQPVAPEEFRRRLGLGAVITSSYITWRTPPLRAVAESQGIHGLIGFSGPVMTDSGAFQQHAYGSVEVGPEEILEFQEAIGSDIATILDVFTEPETPHDLAEAALHTTLERAVAGRAARKGLLAVPVQGGQHADLRAASAREASRLGDVLAVGGVVPLLEQYRFVELARQLAAARPELTPAAPVHLFGAGHPMTFAFAALFGVDLIDSSAYQKFARRGRLLLPEGTVALEEVTEATCHCFLCADMPLRLVARLPPDERERRLAFHNLLTSAEEMALVRQAIRDGTLWELAERRTVAHPSLRAGLEEARRHPEIFLPTEPESRRAFREVDPSSRGRPAVVRFQHRLEAYSAPHPPARRLGRIGLRPEYLRHIPLEDRAGRELRWEMVTPLGPVPIELIDQYPVGPYLGVDEFLDPPRHRPPRALQEEVAAALGDAADLDRDWTEPWTRFQIHALLEWQYGAAIAIALAPGLRGERSRRTGRLRSISLGPTPMFVVGTDGVPHPTFRGAERLHELLSPEERRIVVHADAVPFVRAGRTLFSRFVVRADPRLVPGTTALLVDPSGVLIAIGRLLLAPHEMGRLARGVAVRVTAHRSRPIPDDDDRGEDEEPGEGRPVPGDL